MAGHGISLFKRADKTYWGEQLFGSKATQAGLRLQAKTRGESGEAPSTLAIRAIAETNGCSPAQVVLAWDVQRGISAIPKSVTPSRLLENLRAADLKLSETDLQKIEALDQDFRLVNGSFWVMEGGPWTLQSLRDTP